MGEGSYKKQVAWGTRFSCGREWEVSTCLCTGPVLSNMADCVFRPVNGAPNGGDDVGCDIRVNGQNLTNPIFGCKAPLERHNWCWYGGIVLC